MSGIIERDIPEDSVIVAQCNTCVYRVYGTAKCKAFPRRIPSEILSNEHDHRQKFVGDNGIGYKSIKGKKHPLE